MPKKPKPSKAKSNKPQSRPVKAKSQSSKKIKPTAHSRKSAPKVKAAAPVKPTAKVVARPVPAKIIPSKQFAGAVASLEAGIKLMYTEDFAKAVKVFNKVIADYPEEPEIQASAKARIQACEKKIQERARTVYRTPDDHYNFAIALMNRGDLETALTHLQSALKLAPKADHILYAIAAANALRGNREEALHYLKQSIHHRAENRFQAQQDNDFSVLSEEQAFKDLITPPDK